MAVTTASSAPVTDASANSDGGDAAASAPVAKKAAAKKTAAKKTAAKKTTAKKTAASKAAGANASKAAGAKKTTAKKATKKATATSVEAVGEPDVAIASAPVSEPAPAGRSVADAQPAADDAVSASTPPPRKRASRSRKKAAAAPVTTDVTSVEAGSAAVGDAEDRTKAADEPGATTGGAAQSAVLFQPPTFSAAPLFEPPSPAEPVPPPERESGADTDDAHVADTDAVDDDADDDDTAGRRRRRRRGGRGRRKKADGSPDEAGVDQDTDADASSTTDADASSTTDVTSGSGDEAGDAEPADAESGDADAGDGGGSRRRRRRRRRKGEADTDDTRTDDPPKTVVKVRDAREAEDEVSSVKGSTRLEAKKQRRREGREAGRRRPPILTESEFLARREAVDRVMAVRQEGDVTQIAVLEDGVLVEHYVSRASQQSMIGNVYLGRVQNVLPAMEAAFVDVGRGRNAVVYAGEVDWAGLGHTDGPKRIEDVLKSGQSALVQITKDPVGHKGARLTGQISLPGRYVVYVPSGSMSGISRKLPDSERNRLKKILRKVVPDDAGVIVRTAAEGASEEELTNDVARLQAEWEAIKKKASGNAPALLHGEPDLAIKVVRDLFNEDFTKLVVSGRQAWDAIDDYVSAVASSLRDRVEKWTKQDDLFAALRVDEQIAKALDRKVWLPSGGSLVIDRTEAMTVIDVNTGKFTGSGGNLEETVTKNNLEAAEEIVRQLRLRDIGGIIVVDFIDMVLESNRDLVLRRLVECLGRDRTKHQVAEVTSLGLVQMTRKRIGTGLVEAFSEPCPHCRGRGLVIHTHPGEAPKPDAASSDEPASRSDRRGRRRKSEAPDKTEPAIAPKLEAMATPGEASPADLVPVTREGHGAISDDQAAGSAEPSGTPEATADDAPANGDSAARPRTRRGRRRAERPAGSPDERAPASA
ncbi:Rne/Rng family ribonuclease [Phytoactinopolyspora limicola]|uniref:Rne/Rng family ribonuclease n=1 Tax=Phytoactinopolyspora limicola TaxID=2715536 RepID=UPI001A9C485E|nr:Rne/Rng family ribonuclease [Phytoactinopolyspora limicola]